MLCAQARKPYRVRLSPSWLPAVRRSPGLHYPGNQGHAADIRATSRLNKLYLELPHEPLHDTLIFCFFRRGYGHFRGCRSIRQDGRPDERNNVNQHARSDRHALGATNVPTKGNARRGQDPGVGRSVRYVNGCLFGGSVEVSRSTRFARIYVLHAGLLDWH